MDTDISELNPYSTPPIQGLQYFSNYITEQEERTLLDKIDNNAWSTQLRRRVQHYGYLYDYRKRTVDLSMRIGDLPSWTMSIAARFQADQLLRTAPDQVIINEYLPGQGIANHIDCPYSFGNTVLVVSLGSACVMQFVQPERLDRYELLLQEGSLLLLCGTARYEWQHGIPARKWDTLPGYRFRRKRRVSMTFRTVRLKGC